MKSFPLILCTLALVLPTPAVRAASNANDVASNYAGQSTYLNINGGTGWSNAFTALNSTSPNAFLASAGQINTAGLSFGLTGSTISRSFSGILNSGQIFRFQLQPGSVPAGSSFNFGISNSNQVSTGVTLSYSTSSPNYLLNTMTFSNAVPSTQTVDTGVPFSTNALSAAFSAGNGSFTLALTPAGGTTTALTNPYTGFAGGISLYTTGGATMYFNSLAAVPEPSSWAILALGVAGLAGWRAMRGQLGKRMFA